MASFSPLPLVSAYQGWQREKQRDEDERARQSQIQAVDRADDQARSAQATLDQNNRQTKADSESLALTNDLAETERKRLSSLAQDMAQNRATWAARGIDPGQSASARALLDGLEEETDTDLAAKRGETQRRLKSIRDEVEGARRADLLELAAQRQRAQLLHGTTF